MLKQRGGCISEVYFNGGFTVYACMVFSHSPLQYVEKSFDPSTIPTLKDIDHEEDIKKLSVRQLKTILVRNYVDIKGCVERKELVERLQRLWESRKMEQGTSVRVNVDTKLRSTGV